MFYVWDAIALNYIVYYGKLFGPVLVLPLYLRNASRLIYHYHELVWFLYHNTQ